MTYSHGRSCPPPHVSEGKTWLWPPGYTWGLEYRAEGMMQLLFGTNIIGTCIDAVGIDVASAMIRMLRDLEPEIFRSGFRYERVKA